MRLLPHPANDIVIVTVVLAVYPTDAPLLPATEKVPQLPVVVVVVVDDDEVVLVDDVVEVTALEGSTTLPDVRITDSRRNFAPPIWGTVWYLTTTVRRLRLCPR
jgi:hypothetical protein